MISAVYNEVNLFFFFYKHTIVAFISYENITKSNQIEIRH